MTECTGNGPATPTEGQVREAVWNGAVIVKFSVDRGSLTNTSSQPEPIWWHVPRISYLPLCTQFVRERFSPFVSAPVEDMWFEAPGNIPLKWHVPMGVLYDLYGTEHPWPLVVHYNKFPTDKLLRCPSLVQNGFMHVLKEASCLKCGDITRINNLSKKELEDLWLAIEKNDLAMYTTLNNKLQPTTWKNVPVRICRPHMAFIQDLVPVLNPQGNPRTLEEVLRDALPEDFPPSPASSAASASTIPAMATPSNTSTVPNNPRVTVLVQGITPPLCTPVVWMAATMCHPDNFLYVIVKKL
ncbi:autophagy protein 5 [Pelomyxa schiedti]|nr:autophagy protein 5 [Pelomyxa schiedti]